jgi:Holliday junction resolvase-like predicted endonuclease
LNDLIPRICSFSIAAIVQVKDKKAWKCSGNAAAVQLSKQDWLSHAMTLAALNVDSSLKDNVHREVPESAHVFNRQSGII